ncbi:MAG: tyrosine--tRNA ligase [Alphaproteobacteria bacterium]
MSAFKSDFMRTLSERGFIHQCSDPEGLDALASRQVVTAYIGFDCTADSLHVGNLMGIMLLRWLQKTGHKPVVLMGGGTTRVGDPSGKDEARRMLTDADIAANMAGIRRVFGKFLTFGDGPTEAVMVNNDDWLRSLNYIDLLRDVGRHFSINRMLTFDSVKLRLEREQPLTFLEFNYMILQAYDFVELNRKRGVRLQMGGSDQWGNIINGVELSRRLRAADALPEEDLFALTCPLITSASGAKMGKTAAGAMWLNAERLSPYDYWQFWRNTDDADVGRFLKLFTELPLAEIEALTRVEGAALNEAKKVLATEATRMAHGDAAAEEAAETARRAFEVGGAAEGLPTVTVGQDELDAGIPAYALFVRAGLAESSSAARRLIQGGGGRLNDDRIDDENRLIGSADLLAGGTLKLSAGKKKHVLVGPG